MTFYTRRSAVMLLLAAMPVLADHRPVGDSQIFAPVPAPGYPEGIAVRGNRVYVSGPAAFGLTGAPYVFEYDLATGALTNQFEITFSNPFAGMRGASCLGFGPDNKLYVIEPFVGVIRMELNAANTQSVYATFPPSPNSLLNDLAFDENGNLYVTDSFAGLIYKVPAGGGAAQVWFQDARLLGNPQLPFGVNGIRVDKKGKRIYFSVTVRQDFSGAIYRLPLVNSPTAAQLEEFHVFPATPQNPFPAPAPDGIAFAKNGRLYVSLAGSNQISVLNQSGGEFRRFTAPANVPWVNPANIAFDDDRDRILVTNHASLLPVIDPSLFFVFDVGVSEKGEALP